jgi:hypothetical protein
LIKKTLNNTIQKELTLITEKYSGKVSLINKSIIIKQHEIDILEANHETQILIYKNKLKTKDNYILKKELELIKKYKKKNYSSFDLCLTVNTKAGNA